MEAVRRWAISLAMLTLLAGVAESMAPQGSTKRYVRVALGVIVLSMVLEPVIDIVARVKSIDSAALSPFVTRSQPASPASALDTTRQAYEGRVRWQVESMAASVQGVLSASAGVRLGPENGGVPSVAEVTLNVSLTAESRGRAGAVQEALRALLSAYLNITSDRVVVKVLSQ